VASASELNKGNFFSFKGEILQVLRKELVAYGTHSHSKLKLSVSDVYGKKERVLTFAHEDKVDILDIKKKTGNVLSKTPKGVQIMDPFSYETMGASADSRLLEEINEGDEVIFINNGNVASILEKKR
jgi:translation elongation factor P/translation initiation factor 5A